MGRNGFVDTKACGILTLYVKNAENGKIEVALEDGVHVVVGVGVQEEVLNGVISLKMKTSESLEECLGMLRIE